jgi:hypothetical protein
MAALEDAEELHKRVYDLTKQGKSAELKMLLNDHLNVDVDEYRDDEYDWRALDIACVDGRTECARLLIEHKADVNAKDEGGPAALHNAADSEKLGLVKLLVQHGADVNCIDEHGWTPLMNCLLNADIVMAHYLLEHKADVNYRIAQGLWQNKDALHCAMREYTSQRTPFIVFAILSFDTDAKNVRVDEKCFTTAMRDAHIEEYMHVQAYIDEYHRVLNLVLSEHVPVDPRFGLGQMGIYQEPLERTLEYLGLSMTRDQVANMSIDGEAVRRALIPSHLLNAKHWFDKFKKEKLRDRLREESAQLQAKIAAVFPL